MAGTTLMTVTNAAKLKGVRRQDIYYHLKAGNLQRIDIDGVVFVERDAVINLRPRGKGEYRKRIKKTDYTASKLD